MVMQKKALVVDNDFFFVEFISELLEKRGYQVLKAYNGKEGIAKLEQGPVDILFADLVLPKVDGRQFFNFIRKKYNGSHFPMVALSGTMIEQLGALHEIAADYYIAKGPIDLLSVKLNEFISELETHPAHFPKDLKVLATGNVFPRRDAMELLNSLRFHQAVIECAAVGIIVVDSDTRIINANRAALGHQLPDCGSFRQRGANQNCGWAQTAHAPERLKEGFVLYQPARPGGQHHDLADPPGRYRCRLGGCAGAGVARFKLGRLPLE